MPAKLFLWQLCAGDLRVCRFSDPGSPTCVQLSPNRLATIERQSTFARSEFTMERYMPLTGIDLIPASLLIDTQAPLDVLQATADYRIRTVTQVLENIAFRAQLGCDTVVLKDFSQLLAIPLRDGCDLMDVIGRRLRAQAKE
jgi:hypothetical protein